jgi:peptidyl-Lys metalloendopeptidase
VSTFLFTSCYSITNVVPSTVGHAYDFTKPGAGKYTIGARNSFMVVNSDDSVDFIEASVGKKSHSRVAGKLRAARPGVDDALDKRATYVSCSSTRQSQLVTAASSAQSYAAGALSYANSISSGTTRYTTWFGAYSSSNLNTVRSHFSLISSRQFSSFTYDCTCTESGTYAYVYPGT